MRALFVVTLCLIAGAAIAETDLAADLKEFDVVPWLSVSVG